MKERRHIIVKGLGKNSVSVVQDWTGGIDKREQDRTKWWKESRSRGETSKRGRRRRLGRKKEEEGGYGMGYRA
jgi:hypothetical protein